MAKYTIEDKRVELLADLNQALGFTTPTSEMSILEHAAVRIRELEEARKKDTADAIRWAREVFPDAKMVYTEHAIWSLVAEVKRLRAKCGE